MKRMKKKEGCVHAKTQHSVSCCAQEAVLNIEDSLNRIEAQLDELLTSVQETECYVSNANVEGIWVDR